jgi:serine protease AprX
MAKVNVLIEVEARQEGAFSAHAAAMDSTHEATSQAAQLLNTVPIAGVEIVPGFAPVPLFGEGVRAGFAAFARPTTNPDQTAESMVVAALVDSERLNEIKNTPGVKVYPNSELTLFQSPGPVDRRPFPYRPAVPIGTIRALLGTGRVWRDGFYGQNIIVGIADEGINGVTYPVVGGFSLFDIRSPGTAPVTSHGSMCAADVLIAAPGAQLYDYPFLTIPNSFEAINMYQEILEHRRIDGTPHLINNSWGFVGDIPGADVDPSHEVNDINHPLHRKIREVVASGARRFSRPGTAA